MTCPRFVRRFVEGCYEVPWWCRLLWPTAHFCGKRRDSLQLESPCSWCDLEGARRGRDWLTLLALAATLAVLPWGTWQGWAIAAGVLVLAVLA